MTLSVVATFTGAISAGSAAQASQRGDIFIACAWRNGSSTPPSLASGWNALNTVFSAGGTARGARLAYKRATGTTTLINDTWTNATIVLIVQLRPAAGKGAGIGASAGATASGVSATPGYPALTFIGGAAQTKYVLSFGGCTSSATDIDSVAPASSAPIGSHSDASNEIAAFLSSAVSSWALNSPTISASVPWLTACFEVYEWDDLQYWDSFDRANANLGASLVASGTNGGWNWIDNTGGTPGAATIASNKLQANTTVADGYIFSTPDFGHRNMYVEWTVEAVGANSSFFDIRYVDLANKLSVRQNGTNINVFKRVATSYTSLHSANYSLVAGDIVRLEAFEDAIYLYKNGVFQATAAIGDVINGTKGAINPRTALYTDWARDIKFGTFITPAAAGGLAKVWSGSAWAEKPVKVWSGSAWAAKPVKIWNGSTWVAS